MASRKDFLRSFPPSVSVTNRFINSFRLLNYYSFRLLNYYSLCFIINIFSKLVWLGKNLHCEADVCIKKLREEAFLKTKNKRSFSNVDTHSALKLARNRLQTDPARAVYISLDLGVCPAMK